MLRLGREDRNVSAEPGGKELLPRIWRVDTDMDWMIQLIEVIVRGNNIGVKRIMEFFPERDRKRGKGV
jgi:hypothetical protein